MRCSGRRVMRTQVPTTRHEQLVQRLVWEALAKHQRGKLPLPTPADDYPWNGWDESFGLWLYGTALALITGVAGVPLALRNVHVLPRWQWAVETSVAGVAILAAVISVTLALL